MNRPALTTNVIDYYKGPDFTAIREVVGHEIQAPTLVQHGVLPAVGPLQINNSASLSGRDAIGVDYVLSRVPSGTGFKRLFEHILQQLLV